MNQHQVHAAWAPAGAPWSPWVKPVLFAHLAPPEGVEPAAPNLPEWPAAAIAAPLRDLATTAPHPFRAGFRRYDAAIVVDLPGADGLLVGLALAREGFRPVPLYNAVPGEHAVVDLRPHLALLVAGAPLLDDVPLDAPPAFLLDAHRRGLRSPEPGDWDNRSVSLPTDFPSATALLGASLRRAVVVRDDGEPPLDLAMTLRAWQEEGIPLLGALAGPQSALAPFHLGRPWLIGRALHAFGQLFLKRRPGGEYGDAVPLPSAGG
jgi:hypothetical protein